MRSVISNISNHDVFNSFELIDIYIETLMASVSELHCFFFFCFFFLNRFRHFEELHRRLKEFPEYNLHLPPKHFLSTGLDVPVIQERCKLLDKYLKVRD